MKKLNIHYDAEGDFIEIRFGKPKPSYYEYMEDDTFKRVDKKTKKVFGYAFYNVKKREYEKPQDIEVEIPIAA